MSTERRTCSASPALALTAFVWIGACSGTIGPTGGDPPEGRTPTGPGATVIPPTSVGEQSVSGTDPSRPGNPTSPGAMDPSSPATRDPTAPGGTDPPVTQAECAERGVEAARALMRRLTHAEYDNTVLDLLGDTSAPAKDFVADGRVGLFDNNAYSPMTSLLITQYAEAAEELAERAVTRLDQLLPCDPSDDEEGCARDFIATFGGRAYRRPLSSAEMERMQALYAELRATGDYSFEDGIRVVVQAFLQSPNFLYHVEHGATDRSTGTAVPLTGYEMASRLSYFLWGTMPDPPLFEAAEAGVLDDETGLMAEFDRMIGDPRTKQGVLRFYRQWLGIDKLARVSKSSELFPEWDDALAGAAQAETERLIDHIVWEGDGKLSTLLTARFSFLNESLANLYGVSGITGPDLRRADLDPNQRSGILSHASVLAVNAHSEQTSPVHRGKFVRERLLCHDLPSPPPTVDVTPPKADPTLTTRQRYAQHSADEYCAGCHRLMDPIGLGFESYDAIGRYRSEENGLPIDDTGDIVASRDSDGPFEGPIELAARLAASEEVMECVAKQWFGYAAGRGTSFPEDACSISDVGRTFAESGGNLREILGAVVRSHGFRYRDAIPATEVCQ